MNVSYHQLVGFNADSSSSGSYYWTLTFIEVLDPNFMGWLFHARTAVLEVSYEKVDPTGAHSGMGLKTAMLIRALPASLAATNDAI